MRLAIPLLHVSDSRAAEEFYCEKLGFDLVSATRATTDADPCYVALQREGALIHLSSFAGDGTAGAAVVFAVDDVDALHAEFLTRGVRIHVDPVDQTWGNREMYIKDADGNSLRFVSRPRAR